MKKEDIQINNYYILEFYNGREANRWTVFPTKIANGGIIGWFKQFGREDFWPCTQLGSISGITEARVATTEETEELHAHIQRNRGEFVCPPITNYQIY